MQNLIHRHSELYALTLNSKTGPLPQTVKHM